MTLEEAAKKFPIGARVVNRLNGNTGTVEAADRLVKRRDGCCASSGRPGEIFVAVRWDRGDVIHGSQYPHNLIVTSIPRRHCLCGEEIPDDDSYACDSCVREMLYG